MPLCPIRPIVVAAVFAAAALCAAGYRRHCTLRHALLTECAARRLTEAVHGRDVEALSVRFQEALHARAVLDQADMVLDVALATHHQNPEGGPV